MCNMRQPWSASTDWETVCRRASWRRYYNSVRRVRALYRRNEVARLLTAQGALFDHGTQARLARQLGVSRSTICRDVAALLREGWPCPHCGAYKTPPEALDLRNRPSRRPTVAALSAAPRRRMILSFAAFGFGN